MKGVHLVMIVLVATGLVAAPAEAEHVCYTLGDYQVCTGIPGDELAEDVFRLVFGCDRPC